MNIIAETAEMVLREYAGRDIFETAENAGAIVWRRDLGSLKGFYLCENGRRYIIVNSGLDRIVSRTVCAHELGHDMLHRELSAGGMRENTLFLASSKTEREANLFAAEVLLSDDEVLSVMEYSRTLEQAAYELSAMPEIVAYKLEMMNSRGYDFRLDGVSSDFLR